MLRLRITLSMKRVDALGYLLANHFPGNIAKAPGAGAAGRAQPRRALPGHARGKQRNSPGAQTHPRGRGHLGDIDRLAGALRLLGLPANSPWRWNTLPGPLLPTGTPPHTWVDTFAAHNLLPWGSPFCGRGDTGRVFGSKQSRAVPGKLSISSWRMRGSSSKTCIQMLKAPSA